MSVIAAEGKAVALPNEKAEEKKTSKAKKAEEKAE